MCPGERRTRDGAHAMLVAGPPLSLVDFGSEPRARTGARTGGEALLWHSLSFFIHTLSARAPSIGGHSHAPFLRDCREKGFLYTPLQGFPAIPSRSLVSSVLPHPLPS